MTIETQLRKHEGVRNKPYADTVGKITIGVGRNLTDVGLSDAEIDMLLANDINRTVADLDRELSWWRNLNEARQRVMIDMCFNLGIGGLLTFKNALAMIQSGQYDLASTNMLKSKWASQVGIRADTLSKMMRTGDDI